MKYGFYDVTLSVSDANTGIKLYEFNEYHIKARHRSAAISKATGDLVDTIHKDWLTELYNKLCLFDGVGLTATQLKYLVSRGYIKQPKDKVLAVKQAELTSWVD